MNILSRNRRGVPHVSFVPTPLSGGRRQLPEHPQKEVKMRSALNKGVRAAASSAKRGWDSLSPEEQKSFLRRFVKTAWDYHNNKKGVFTKDVKPLASGATTRSSHRYGRAGRWYRGQLRRKVMASFSRFDAQAAFSIPGAQASAFFNIGGKSDWYNFMKAVGDASASTSTPVATELRKTFMPKSANLILNIANTDLVTCYIMLYIVTPRTDTPESFLGSWIDEAEQRSFTDSSYLIGPTTPMVMPWGCRSTLQQYKIHKIIKIELPQGAQHIHTQTMYFGRPLSPSLWTTTIGSQNLVQEYMRHHNLQIVLTAYGAPVHSSANTSTVSTGSVQLDIVTKIEYKGTRIDIPQGRMNIDYNFGTVETEAFVSAGGNDATEPSPSSPT